MDLGTLWSELSDVPDLNRSRNDWGVFSVQARWTATDLFSGCGGLTAGLRCAGFNVVSAVEIDELAADTFESNHSVKVIRRDITDIDPRELRPGGGHIDLVAGCPPCQGFSRVRRQNRRRAARDDRNSLIGEYQRIVEALLPSAVFMENVPGIERDYRFNRFVDRLKELGYNVAWDILELAEYGIPQRRRRVVLLAGMEFTISPEIILDWADDGTSC